MVTGVSSQLSSAETVGLRVLMGIWSTVLATAGVSRLRITCVVGSAYCSRARCFIFRYPPFFVLGPSSHSDSYQYLGVFDHGSTGYELSSTASETQTPRRILSVTAVPESVTAGSVPYTGKTTRGCQGGYNSICKAPQSVSACTAVSTAEHTHPTGHETLEQTLRLKEL